MNNSMRTMLFTLATLAGMFLGIQAKHFRGGTISWKPLGNKTVDFSFKLGWKFGLGPGCEPDKLGKFVDNQIWEWKCLYGCVNSYVKMETVNYYCTGADEEGDWEQGQNTFRHTFDNDGPFTVGFTHKDWVELSNGKGDGPWNISTKVEIGKRSDIGGINSSPVSQSQPIYYPRFNCDNELKIPITDPDSDSIRCRWASGSECASICDALPGAQLDEEKCTIRFNATTANGYEEDGLYAVALTIEDYPRAPMTMGGRTVTPTDAMSSIPLQFLVQTVGGTGSSLSCDAVPRFVSPTPEENEVIDAEEGETVVIKLYADNGNDTTIKIKKMRTSGPVGMTQSLLTQVATSENTFQMASTWTPKNGDIGDHIICASVENAIKVQGKERCFIMKVVLRTAKTATTTTIPTTTTSANVASSSTPDATATVGATVSVKSGASTVGATHTGATLSTATHPGATVAGATHPGATLSSATHPGATVAGATHPGAFLSIATHPGAAATANDKPTTTINRFNTTRSILIVAPTRSPVKYGGCSCVITTPSNKCSSTRMSRTARDVCSVFFGIPFGGVLSILTTLAFRRWGHKIKCPFKKDNATRISPRQQGETLEDDQDPTETNEETSA